MWYYHVLLCCAVLSHEHWVMCSALRPHRLQPSRFLCPWNFPGKNTGKGCHFLLQKIFPTQRLNLSVCVSCISWIGRQIPYHRTTWDSLVAQMARICWQCRRSKLYPWIRKKEKGMASHFSILAWRIPWTDHGVAKSWTWLSN